MTTPIDNPWIDCDRELPPCDGWYEIRNAHEMVWGKAEYDGYGFLIHGAYRQPDLWRHSKPKEKRYGKQK